MSDLMQERLDRAERALTHYGFTYTEGAQEWKPPIGPSASPLLDRIDQLTGALLEARQHINGGAGIKYGCEFRAMFERIDAALAGKLPERPDTEWTDAASTPTAQDYRELQAQHDQLQSKHKAALDALSSAVKTAEFEGHAHRPWHDSAKTLLTGQVSEPVYYMRDNHTFKRLSDNVDIAIAEIEAELDAGWTSGMLCSERNGFRHLHANSRRPREEFISDCRYALLAAAPKPEGAA